ncbi:carbohydrate ABC transporter permease [Kineothrix sp. MB12-C1]|uniref:carbohydrate ABC transporter permease n=1 Tax=Kineothrix sp. MB12-C1 TaxID=3070215 RepID=UPI0027D1F3D9|nr:sugar ABC transporter permease [Kineothrix sp. MB12-C1]WMC94437.1 sugar ABC transporter permease [Kineothrix sp. MB12-C1]
MGKVKKKKGYSSRENMGYAFIAPFVLVFLTFNIYPVVRTLYLSFTDYSGFNIPTWVGMGNYIRVFKDKLLWEAFGNTIRIWGVNIILQLGIAFLLTIVFSDMKYRTRGLSMFRALFYLPNLIAATSVAYLFKTMMDWKYGSFNQIIKGLGIVNEGVDWMGTPPLLRTVVGVVGAWMWFGNSFILLMAGVQGINKDYYEAAAIDGAGRFTVFGKITIPLLKPIMLYVAITSLIGGLQLFDIPYLMTLGQQKQTRAVTTAVMHLYMMAFKNRQIGYAGAIAFILFFIICICSIGVYLMMYAKQSKEED